MTSKLLVIFIFICQLAIFVPANAASGPTSARATATVFARVLQPVSLSISQELKNNRLTPAVKVSSTNRVTYQLQVNDQALQSYQQTPAQISRSLQSASPRVETGAPRTVAVTLNFN